MTSKFKKASGYSLLISSLLASLTMLLHPNGGNFEHIVHIKFVIIQSHSIAIFCLPFLCFGFWGLSVLLDAESKIATFAFFMSCFGLLAGLIAAAINGLVLPQFASANINSPNIDTIKSILNYAMFFNISLAYIFITFLSLAIGVWSFLIIRTRVLKIWLGYYGLLLIVFGLIAVVFKFNFASVNGFTVYILGIVSWKILVGLSIAKSKNSF